MTLRSDIEDLALRVATEAKALRTLTNGNQPDLSALTTTAKANLVAAINEVVASVGSAAGIDDLTTSTTSTWSSSKTDSEIVAASTADRDRANHTGTQSADTIVDGTTNHVFTAADDTKLAGIAAGATANATDAQLRDRATHTGTQSASTISDFAAAADARAALLINDASSSTTTVYSSAETAAQIAAATAALVNGAPGALDDLNELAAALGDDANFAGTVTTALGLRVRVDAAQAFTEPQQVQARTNIGAASAADVGDLTGFDPVQTFEDGLL